MDLRVWVDGIQRVVSGVRLTTTCQEIVFALAHATQQTGRFTMVERWRNNERLLSPNEQLLVTLQRWGDQMQEVEFILRRSVSTANTNATAKTNLPYRTAAGVDDSETSDNHHQQQVSFSNRESPTSTASSTTIDKYFDRGPLDNQQRSQQAAFSQMNKKNIGLMNTSKQSGQEHCNNVNQHSDSSPAPMINQHNNHYGVSAKDADAGQIYMSSVGNGYGRRIGEPMTMPNNNINNNNNHQKNLTNSTQLLNDTTNHHDDEQMPKNYPYEDLYSTVNKKKNNPPPAVPAKPRMAPMMPSTSSSQLHQQQMAQHHQRIGMMRPNFCVPVNATQRFVYGPIRGQSVNSIMTQRLPTMPDFHDINNGAQLTPVASSSSLTSTQSSILPTINSVSNSTLRQPINDMINSTGTDISNAQSYLHHPSMVSYENHIPRAAQNSMGNIRHRCASTAALTNNPTMQTQINETPHQNVTGGSLHPAMQPQAKIDRSRSEASLVINRGSAVNVRLPPSDQTVMARAFNEISNINTADYTDSDSDVAVVKVGKNMLQVIESQKKLLLEQRDELSKMGSLTDLWDRKRNIEQNELLLKIEGEIQQLEKLWTENKSNINRLSSQDYELELKNLKLDRVRLGSELDQQKDRLQKCEADIVACQQRISSLTVEVNCAKDSSEENHDNDERTQTGGTLVSTGPD